MKEEDAESSARPLWDLLRERYPVASHVLFPEVRNATGAKGDRSADAVSMCLYPSQGLEVSGFEFKASRGDWLRELKDPRKADGVFRYCNRWWLVATGRGIADVDELPPTWGMLMARKDGLRVVKQAPALEPIPLDRAFIASLCRAAQNQAVAEFEKLMKPLRAERHQLREELRAEFTASQKAALEQERQRSADRHADIIDGIKQFEAASGIDLFGVLTTSRRWNLPRVAAVAKLLTSLSLEDFSRIDRFHEATDAMLKLSRAAVAELGPLRDKLMVHP